MTAPPAASVRLADPAELISAVPHLLGFHPRDSLVLLALDGTRLAVTLRADLPRPGDEPLLAEGMVAPLAGVRPTAAVLLAVGAPPGGRPPPGPGAGPHEAALAAVDAVEGALADAGVVLVHAAWAAATTPGAPWRCYDDPACGGALPDASGSAVAAASVAAGLVVFPSREDLAAVLAPDDPAALARRAELLARADAEHPLRPAVAARRWRAIVDLHARARTAEVPTLADRTVASVVSALCDSRIRDACLGLAVEGAPDAGRSAARTALEAVPDAVAAERLWLALTRATPAPDRAEPAALLGLTAYLRGDGALAGLALDAALAACPDHSLATGLRAALDGGVPPGRIREIALDAASAARAGLS